MISAAKSGRRDSNQSGDGVVKKPEESAQEKLEKCAQWSKKMGMAMPSVPGKVVLDQSTIERLRHKGVVKTADEKLAATALYAANEERLKNESEARKLELKQQNMYRTKGPKLAQLDGDAHKTSHLLAKAFEMRQNREPEIQYCNSLILSTKCHAIRCAQLEEKERNQKRMKEEKRRMVEMVEQQRILASKKYDQDMEIERLKKKKQADEIVNQMKENENTREFEAARDAQDAKIRMEAAMEAQRAVIRDHHAKLLKQAEMRQEALQINTQLKDMKKMEKDLINLEIKQIQEYNRKKAEREKAYEDLMLKQKREKEIEIAKIQASQLASQDLQAAKDELNMLRIQDQVEKEWRRKERETALKKIQINDDLREARRLQIEGQREYQAFEIQRENEEFNRIIRLNVEDMEKTKEQDRQTKLAIDEHRKNLLKQINAKEWEKIQERKDFFQEGVAYQEGEIARNKSLHETMLKKVEEIRLHNLPTKYIQGIERQLKLKE